jgi:elongation factor Ts
MGKASLEAIKTLREKTGSSYKDVQAALETSGGDEARALAWLTSRGAQVAHSRAGRATAQGRIEAYIHHNGRLGALVEINCESDFVARTQEFVEFCRDVAMQVAATGPRYLRVEDAPSSLPKEEAAALCLLEQPSVKDASATVAQRLNALIGQTGENMVIRRFHRFAIGESPEPS